MRHQRWRDLSPRQRRGIIAAGTVQVGLAAFAWVDLARRPQTQVRGPKPLWAVLIAVNFIGPVSYLLVGRAPGRSRG